MKTIQIWSRDADRKILVVLCFLFCLALAAVTGSLLPEPEPADNIRILDAFIAAMLLVFVWAGFRLARPLRCRQRWVIAEVITVPLLWLLLIIALGIWFAHLRSAWEIRMELMARYGLL